jgi:squalene-hopene/tetraprenyl-beta-curcumene cyclase
MDDAAPLATLHALTADPALDRAIEDASDALLRRQRPDGHWVFELEADATIPAEYVLLVHYLGETPDLDLERKIGVYLRRSRVITAVGRSITPVTSTSARR